MSFSFGDPCYRIGSAQQKKKASAVAWKLSLVFRGQVGAKAQNEKVETAYRPSFAG